ncbi:MAG: hypothetical protein V4642_04115 [Bacteroidota bacterium]
MITKEESYNQISLLINRFAEQIDDYKKSGYNETQTRRDFIDPPGMIIYCPGMIPGRQ